MLLIFGKNGVNKNSDAYAVNNYTLYDKFATALSAGSVNGTSAEPVGGARTVTDTNSKISIAGGVLSFATGAAANDGVWYTALSRVLGKTLLMTAVPVSTSPGIELGWDSNSSGNILDSFRFGAGGNLVVFQGGVSVGAFTATQYKLSITSRTNGMFYFIKGGAFANWSLVWLHLSGVGTLSPSIISFNTTGIVTADNIRVPERLYIPVPLQSDGFSAATTDGAGNAEANGAVGNAYTNIGTWGVASGARSCSVLSGGLGFSYLACSSSNVITDAAVTRGAGVAGLVARYASATDYLLAYHDGTNAKLDKVVAGVTTSLISAAATYSAGAVMRLILDGTSARLFYNNAAVGTVATTPAAGSLNHGLYTTDILSNGNSFDNLIVWARGNENQYSGLDAL